MRSTALWIVGEPGAGKTTLARGLLGEVRRTVDRPKWTVGERASAAGHYTGRTFDGADTISYSGAIKTLEDSLVIPVGERRVWDGLVLLDGDRMSNERCLRWVDMISTISTIPTYNVRTCCVLVSVPEQVAGARRAERARQAGVPEQNPAWVKGRATKARRFFDLFGRRERLEVPSGHDVTPEQTLSIVRTWLWSIDHACAGGAGAGSSSTEG